MFKSASSLVKGEPLSTCPKEPGAVYVLLVSGASYDGLVPVLAEWNTEVSSDGPGWAEWFDGELCGTGLRRGAVIEGWLPTGARRN